MEPREFYFVAEVAEILRMDPERLRLLIKAKRIAFHQDHRGAQIRIKHSDLMDYLERIRVDVEPEKERPAKTAGKEIGA